MDWANERYVRVYTRDTVSWKLCDWRAHTTLLHLFRKVDRAGVVEVGNDGVVGLAAVLELPIEIVESGIEQLTRSAGRPPTVEFTGVAYAIPNFIEAQETPQSDPQRARESRAKRRDLHSVASQNVTQPSQNVTQPSRNVTQPSRAVTSGHVVSRAVTSGHVVSRAVTSGHVVSRAVTPTQTRPDQTRSMSGTPDAAAVFADRAVSLINAASESKYKPTSAAVLKLCKALVKNKHTIAELERVVASKRAWIGDAKMGPYFRPATLLSAENFRNYLDDLEARPCGPTVWAHGQPYRTVAGDDAVSPLMLAFEPEAEDTP